MRPRHAVLLTPLEGADPVLLPYSKQIAPLTPLDSALPSDSQPAENKATLSPVECALTRLSPATPLESALTKNTGGGGLSFRFWNSSLRTGHRHPRSFFSCTYELPILQLLSFQIHACNGGGTPWRFPHSASKNTTAGGGVPPFFCQRQSVPNRTDGYTLQRVYTPCAILPFLHSGDRPFLPPWRPS
jgi:hypothetical protein